MLVGTSAPALAQHTTVRAMTLNTRHGGIAPWHFADQVAAIVAESPDIVFLQEVPAGQLDDYVKGINAGLKSTAWHGALSRHCVSGAAPRCTSTSGETVVILSRYRFVDVDPRVIWAADQFVAGRAVLRVKLLLDDGTPLQTFSVHLPALSTAAQARVVWMKAFKRWASMYPGSKIVGGDFNERSTAAAVASMSADYVDAWASKGRGDGATHSKDDVTYRSRIDYLFSSGSVKVESAFVPQVSISDHRPVVAEYAVVSSPAIPSVRTQRPSSPASTPASTSDVVLLEDDFDDGVLDTSKWPGRVFSGKTQDDSIAIREANGNLSIGPLKTTIGWHYNAVSSGVYAMAGNAYAQVQLVQGPVGGDAYTMFTAGSDGLNFYRFYQSGPADNRTLSAEKKIADTKYGLALVPFVAGDPLYLRIRHDSRPAQAIDEVVFETSATPAFDTTVVELHREAWDPTIDVSAISFELKAGTSGPDSGDSTVVLWDNFRAAVQQPISGR
jgi:endonuclease/exonuclease/phosphatase family metal-dependent hydrolase